MDSLESSELFHILADSVGLGSSDDQDTGVARALPTSAERAAADEAKVHCYTDTHRNHYFHVFLCLFYSAREQRKLSVQQMQGSQKGSHLPIPT